MEDVGHCKSHGFQQAMKFMFMLRNIIFSSGEAFFVYSETFSLLVTHSPFSKVQGFFGLLKREENSCKDWLKVVSSTSTKTQI